MRLGSESVDSSTSGAVFAQSIRKLGGTADAAKIVHKLKELTNVYATPLIYQCAISKVTFK